MVHIAASMAHEVFPSYFDSVADFVSKICKANFCGLPEFSDPECQQMFELPLNTSVLQKLRAQAAFYFIQKFGSTEMRVREGPIVKEVCYLPPIMRTICSGILASLETHRPLVRSDIDHIIVKMAHSRPELQSNISLLVDAMMEPAFSAHLYVLSHDGDVYTSLRQELESRLRGWGPDQGHAAKCWVSFAEAAKVTLSETVRGELVKVDAVCQVELTNHPQVEKTIANVLEELDETYPHEKIAADIARQPYQTFISALQKHYISPEDRTDLESKNADIQKAEDTDPESLFETLGAFFKRKTKVADGQMTEFAKAEIIASLNAGFIRIGRYHAAQLEKNPAA